MPDRGDRGVGVRVLYVALGRRQTRIEGCGGFRVDPIVRIGVGNAPLASAPIR